MTIVFQGHVKSISSDYAAPGKLAVTICTPMAEAGGKDWVVFIPQEHASNWLPGRNASFTIYTLPDPPKPSSAFKAMK
jgi:hypothetical protein